MYNDLARKFLAFLHALMYNSELRAGVLVAAYLMGICTTRNIILSMQKRASDT
jgi:hypothetical protein